MFRFTPVVKNLIILNVGMFLLQTLITEGNFSLITHWLSLYHIDSDFFMPHQFLTHMFLHGSFTHLLFNMLPLVFLGPALEMHLGDKKFLTLYLVSGLGASVLYAFTHHYMLSETLQLGELFKADPTVSGLNAYISSVDPYILQRKPESFNIFQAFIDNPSNLPLIEASQSIVAKINQMLVNVPMLGASGAIFGILMAGAMYFPNAEIILFPIPIPVKMKYFVMVYGVLELVQGIKTIPGDNVAHFAHVGGMVFAFILIKIWRNQGGANYYR